ncbi:MAG: SH3 domain-containing protein [Eubacteriales bacterium]|nr:SH3 domain-containing protein [Eubacteriales bacterium]
MFQNLKKYLVVAATGIVLTASMTAGAFAAGATANTSVNVRSGAGNNYPVVTCVSKGQSVTVNGSSGNWTKVTANGKSGYIYNKYLSNGSSSNPSSGTSSTPSTTSTSSTTVYSTLSLNVRSGPGTKYGVVTTMSKGQSATKVGVSGNWYQVKVNGKTGYVSSKYVTTSKPSSSSTTATTTPSSSTGNKTYMGNYKLTFYAGDGKTASGRSPRVNHTIAADTSVLPMYSTVYIEGWGTYTVEDRGGAIKGNRIDIFVESNAVANKYGVKYANVYLVK